MADCLLSSAFELLQKLQSATRVKLTPSSMDVNQLVSFGLDLILSRTEATFCNIGIVYVVISLFLLLNSLFRQ